MVPDRRQLADAKIVVPLAYRVRLLETEEGGVKTVETLGLAM